MRYLLSFLSLVFANSLIYSQTVDFILKRPQLNSVDSIEKLNKGELFNTSIAFGVSKDYFPNADKFNLAQPLIYFRNQKLTKLEINYYYSLPDSTMRLISYSWDGNSKMQEDLEKLFDTNTNRLNSYFTSKGEEKNEKHDTWLKKGITWQNDKVHVYQFLISSQTTNRVRVLISWK